MKNRWEGVPSKEKGANEEKSYRGTTAMGANRTRYLLGPGWDATWGRLSERPWILVQGPVILPRLTARDPRGPNGPIAKFVDHKRYLTHSLTIHRNAITIIVSDPVALGMS